MASIQRKSGGTAGHSWLILPPLWMASVYLAAALAEGRDIPPPAWTLEWLVYESRHVAAHMLAFGVEVWLIARAFALPPDTARRDVALVVAVSVILGIGLEALQMARRADYQIVAGLWDIGVDSVGVLAGWAYYRARWRAAPTSNPNPAAGDSKA